ncbi:hypothetical protein, partial [Microcoleus sp. D2_18a_D3]|uniref:hypothetical protein n=1 Tax=Microcoleus sp. D2_18a_D3 TaxID=3055330 RepID=UPI002FD1D414
SFSPGAVALVLLLPPFSSLVSLNYNNLAEIVSFAGWVNQSENRDYYRKADIFCFPSIREFGAPW